MTPKSFTARYIVIVLLLLAPPVWAQQAWLMTYGTAERVEEQFGHNAIWIRDAERGIDQVYNFGFFDFDKPGFYTEYLFGEMVYFALARSPSEELSYYRWRDRSVRAQLLNLDTETVRRLTDWLEARVQPETRDFRYDYYFNNCSNRVRDALDFALGGHWPSTRNRCRPAPISVPTPAGWCRTICRCISASRPVSGEWRTGRGPYGRKCFCRTWWPRRSPGCGSRRRRARGCRW